MTPAMIAEVADRPREIAAITALVEVEEVQVNRTHGSHERRDSVNMRALFIFALLLSANSARAGEEADVFYSATQFYEYCKFHMHSCEGYIAGVSDIMSEMPGDQKNKQLCLPAKIKIQELVSLFLKFARENPKILANGSAAGVISFALHKAYPCKNPN
jgi:hypothetical protein